MNFARLKLVEDDVGLSNKCWAKIESASVQMMEHPVAHETIFAEPNVARIVEIIRGV